MIVLPNLSSRTHSALLHTPQNKKEIHTQTHTEIHTDTYIQIHTKTHAQKYSHRHIDPDTQRLHTLQTHCFPVSALGTFDLLNSSPGPLHVAGQTHQHLTVPLPSPWPRTLPATLWVDFLLSIETVGEAHQKVLWDVCLVAELGLHRSLQGWARGKIGHRGEAGQD